MERSAGVQVRYVQEELVEASKRDRGGQRECFIMEALQCARQTVPLGEDVRLLPLPVCNRQCDTPVLYSRWLRAEGQGQVPTRSLSLRANCSQRDLLTRPPIR